MPRKPNRSESSAWASSRPEHGASTTEFKEWAKENPNRAGDAKRTQRSMGKENPSKEGYQLNASGSQSKVRQNRVANWKSKQPIFGKGSSKTTEEKQSRRQQMIDWSKQNPNRRDNAKAAQGKKRSKRPKAK